MKTKEEILKMSKFVINLLYYTTERIRGKRMKTKEEILKMSKKELINYKDTLEEAKSTNKSFNCFDCYECYDCFNCSDCYECSRCSNCYDCYECYDCSDCSNCSNCSRCSNCSDCFNCYDCYDCSNLVNGLFCRCLLLETKDYDKYYICNIEVSKEEFETKKKELEEKDE